jgi:transcriptional regulator with XRE-family HTH domain
MRKCFPKISLKAARVNAGMTQKHAAKMLSISEATLQNYENGITIPDWQTVEKIEEIYNYPKDYIFFKRKIFFKRATSKQVGY